MAIFVTTDIPHLLLMTIKSKITDGSIDTWEVETIDETDYFTLVDQNLHWSYKARFKAYLEEDKNRLVLGIERERNIVMPNVIYALYHSEFIQMLLYYCDNQFSWINTSANKMDGYDFFKKYSID